MLFLLSRLVVNPMKAFLKPIIAATILAIAPTAMAAPQPLSGRVAVGPIGSATRSWESVSYAQDLCNRNGCWVTDGIETSPGVWIPNNMFPGARSFQEPGTGHGLLEVRPSR